MTPVLFARQTITVIIPAHNEASVISRCLKALTADALPGELDVVVVCNGCKDQTAAVARAAGNSIRVIETSLASKTAALNLGDEECRGFPRFYVDADVVLTLAEVRKLATHLAAGNVLAVAPHFRMDLTDCSWAVRSFYDINGRLPSANEGIGGSGVYGLSEAGRKRFTEFPTLTADDGFVRLLFSPHERATLAGCFSIVFAPKTLKDLIAIKTRSHFGTMELRREMPNLWNNRGPSNSGVLKRLACRPWLWPKLIIYGYVKVRARRRAQRKLLTKGIKWERDDTSRTPSSQTVPHLMDTPNHA